MLIALQADLESVRLRRRNPRWSRAVWQAQQDRLADAFAHADYVADTSNQNANQVVQDLLELPWSHAREQMKASRSS